jgi:hypothetical protein
MAPKSPDRLFLVDGFPEDFPTRSFLQERGHVLPFLVAQPGLFTYREW